MNIPELGTLEEVELRQAWPHEAHSFTPWLAAHLDGLSEAVGIAMELEGREVAVEEFSADILGRNTRDDSLVLIENQLTRTDHSHLGQIMTYLAGLEVSTVIWIAEGFREAHLSAIRWLNDHTIDPFAFFAIKVRAVRIADSPVAPVFEVVVKPNSWERQLHAVAKDRQANSNLRQFRRAFWTHCLDRYPDEERGRTAGADSNRWRLVPECDLVISSYVAKGSVGLSIRGLRGVPPEEVYDRLEPHAEHPGRATGQEFGDPARTYRFSQEYKIDTADKNNWDKMADWLHERSVVYEKALREMGQQAGEC